MVILQYGDTPINQVGPEAEGDRAMRHDLPSPPAAFRGIGYTHAPHGMPLAAFDLSVPKPGPDELLVHVVVSSLNPLDYKLADLNFLGRAPPVVLGFDVSGIVVGRGDAVTRFAIGDAVFGMIATNQDGAWAAGGAGGYALVREYAAATKPEALSFTEAGVLGVCFLSAYLALADHTGLGNAVYILGGGGGVGHLAIQKARALGRRTIISSGSGEASRALAKASGATHVFDYRKDDVAAEIAKLTDGKGVDLVYDTTYNEESFVATAGMVRPGGRWVVLGVGPGKTTRRAETKSPVADILAAKGASLINVNLIRTFTEPGALDEATKALLSRGLDDAATCATAGTVRPHISATIPSEVDAINSALAKMNAGESVLGKIAVIVDKARAG
jgi:NADPH:quinone reductase-like Zn-dependent oxidoreductase